MPLLSIVQNAVMETGLAVSKPTVVVSAIDQTILQAAALANRVGTVLRDAADWAALQREHTFPTVAGQPAYDLPADFHRFIDRTQWDRGTHWRLNGPQGPQAWQAFKSGPVQPGIGFKYRIQGAGLTGIFNLIPTPASVTTLATEYVSANWVKAADGTRKSAFTADDDVALLPEDLITLGLKWRLLAAKGLPYAEEKADYEREVISATGRDGGAPVLLPIGVRRSGDDFGFDVVSGQAAIWG